MSVAFIFNIILIVLLLVFVIGFIAYKVKKTGTDDDSKRSEFERAKEKYSIASMQAFIKKQFDEITRMNLYDLALSEESKGIALFMFELLTLYVFLKRSNIKVFTYFLSL